MLFCVPRSEDQTRSVQKGLILHATPFLYDERPETRKYRQKWVDFVKQKKFHNMLRHFTQDDYILRFSFVDEVINKPFIPRLTSLWNRNNCCAISPCQSGDKNTSGHWRCKASSWNAVRMRESFLNASNFLIYLYCKTKASEIFIFHFFRRSKMRRGGCSLTSILKLISKLLKDFSTRISRV